MKNSALNLLHALFFLNHSSLLVRNLCSFERREGRRRVRVSPQGCCSVATLGGCRVSPEWRTGGGWQSRTGLRGLRAMEGLQGHLVQFPAHNTEDTSVLMQKIFVYRCLVVCFVFLLVAYGCSHHFQTLHCFILMVCWCSGFFSFLGKQRSDVVIPSFQAFGHCYLCC